jgi:hypothetical protein
VWAAPPQGEGIVDAYMWEEAENAFALELLSDVEVMPAELPGGELPAPVVLPDSLEQDGKRSLVSSGVEFMCFCFIDICRDFPALVESFRLRVKVGVFAARRAAPFGFLIVYCRILCFCIFVFVCIICWLRLLQPLGLGRSCVVALAPLCFTHGVESFTACMQNATSAQRTVGAYFFSYIYMRVVCR